MNASLSRSIKSALTANAKLTAALHTHGAEAASKKGADPVVAYFKAVESACRDFSDEDARIEARYSVTILRRGGTDLKTGERIEATTTQRGGVGSATPSHKGFIFNVRTIGLDYVKFHIDGVDGVNTSYSACPRGTGEVIAIELESVVIRSMRETCAAEAVA